MPDTADAARRDPERAPADPQFFFGKHDRSCPATGRDPFHEKIQQSPERGDRFEKGPAMRGVVEKQFQAGCAAAMSFRYEFDPEKPDYANAKQIDGGLDFFVAQPEIWYMAYKAVSVEYRIGHTKWDNWFMNFCHATLGRFFADLTQYRCIFHPKHEERHRPYYISPVDDVFCVGGFRG